MAAGWMAKKKQVVQIPSISQEINSLEIQGKMLKFYTYKPVVIQNKDNQAREQIIVPNEFETQGKAMVPGWMPITKQVVKIPFNSQQNISLEIQVSISKSSDCKFGNADHEQERKLRARSRLFTPLVLYFFAVQAQSSYFTLTMTKQSIRSTSTGVKSASPHLVFATLAFGSGGNLHDIWIVQVFSSLGA